MIIVILCHAKTLGLLLSLTSTAHLCLKNRLLTMSLPSKQRLSEPVHKVCSNFTQFSIRLEVVFLEKVWSETEMV